MLFVSVRQPCDELTTCPRCSPPCPVLAEWMNEQCINASSFDVCREILHMFHQSVMVNVIFLCCCLLGKQHDKNTKRLDKPVRKTGSVYGKRLDPLRTVVERSKHSKIQTIMDNMSDSSTAFCQVKKQLQPASQGDSDSLVRFRWLMLLAANVASTRHPQSKMRVWPQRSTRLTSF